MELEDFKFYNADEVAKITGMTLRVVQREIRRGKINVRKVGMIYKICGAEIKRYVAGEALEGRKDWVNGTPITKTIRHLRDLLKTWERKHDTNPHKAKNVAGLKRRIATLEASEEAMKAATLNKEITQSEIGKEEI